MPRGGHSRSGPAPDPTSLRSAASGASGGWTRMTTPPETPPAWPFGEPTEAEAAEWAALWTRPAASLWEQFSLTRDAAIHVRTSLAFAAGNYSNAALGGLVARQAEALGLTPTGAAGYKWRWPAATPTAPAPGSRSGAFRPDSNRPSARERLAARGQITFVPPPPGGWQTSTDPEGDPA